MPIANVIAYGIGFSPGSTIYIPTYGFLGVGNTELLVLRSNVGDQIALDGDTGDLGSFVDNDGTTNVELFLFNEGNATLTINYPPTIGGDASDGDPSAGTLVLLPGESGPFVLALDTSAAGSKAATFSVSHDGDDSPFTATLDFEVTAAPAGDTWKSRVFRDARQFRSPRV